MNENNEATYTYQNEKYFLQIISLLEELIEAVSGNEENNNA